MAVELQIETSVHIERHYAVTEIAEMWNLSPDKVRELFENEPGVLVIGERSPRHKRRYVTLRIPQTVLERVHRRLSSKVWRPVGVLHDADHLSSSPQGAASNAQRVGNTDTASAPFGLTEHSAGKRCASLLKLRDWQRAQDLIREWEAENRRTVPAGTPGHD